MDDNFIVYTTTDKVKRDEMFEQFRASDDPWERQVVKFSGCQEVIGEKGESVYTFVSSTATKGYARLVYQSTWSVAIPTGRG